MVRCLWFFGSLFDDGSGSFHYCDHPYSGAVLPVQRSYINARERLRLRWTKKKRSKQTKKKPTERDANWWPAKCLPNMNQWLISCRYPQGDGFFLVWCSTFCAKSQHKHHSGGKKKKEKSVQVLDILPKKRSVSLVHTNLLVEWRWPKEMKGSNSFGVST